MNKLDLQKSMVYHILQGNGFDTISRCRILVQDLRIYPPLLGLDAKFYPIELHPQWWHADGFPFHADPQGYPLTSEVVAYLRKQMTHTNEDGNIEMWTQEDLGDACGLRKETAYRMEHEKHPLTFETVSRRALVASVFGQVLAEKEATIYRLFGLDPQAHGVPVATSECVPVIHLPTKHLTTEMLQKRHETQKAFFTEYSHAHAQDRVAEMLEWLREAQALLSLADTTGQRVDLLALQSRYHRLLACIAREKCQKEHIHFHTQKAVKQASHSMSLPNPKVRSNHLYILTTNELFASALFTTAMGYSELNQYDQAQITIDRALHLFTHLQSRHLKTAILGAAAVIHATTATTATEKTLVVSYLNQAARLTPASQSPCDVADDNFFRCDRGLLAIKSAGLYFPQYERFNS